jgi:large subunit ribosomal protein L24
MVMFALLFSALLMCNGEHIPNADVLRPGDSSDVLAALLLTHIPVSAARSASPTRYSDVGMKAAPFRCGDTVKVMAGDDKGKEAAVKKIDRKKKNGPWVQVEGMKMQTKHQKPRKEGETGQKIQQEGWIHISNLKFTKQRVEWGTPEEVTPAVAS